jgi:hypothetical protein
VQRDIQIVSLSFQKQEEEEAVSTDIRSYTSKKNNNILFSGLLGTIFDSTKDLIPFICQV